MIYTAVHGQNKKDYIQLTLENQEDLKTLEVIRSIVSRTEYFPFIKSFNKNVFQTYLINDTFFPVQFLDEVRTRINQIVYEPIKIINEDILYQKIDRTEFDEWIYSLPLPEKYDITLPNYSYQPESVYQSLVNKIARIEVGTSGGKTLITYLYCKYLLDHGLIDKNKKILIVVPRKQLCTQLQDDFKEYNSESPTPMYVETIYSGAIKYLDAHVVCGTYQSLSNYDREYFDDFQALIIDEVHQGKAYSIRNEIFAKCYNIDFTFGLTGTYPEWKTLDYLNIVSMTGKLVLCKKAYQLIDDGNSTPVKINIVRINYSGEDANYSKNLIEQGITGSEKYRIEKEWFQTNNKRTNIILKLIKGIEGNNLILVDTIQYVKILKEFFEENCPDKIVKIVYGNISAEERNEDKKIMEANDNVIMIATYATMSTGVSINNLVNIYFVDGGKSEIRIRQSIGRGLRLHPKKEYCRVFDFQDWMEKSSFKNHSIVRNRIYGEQQFPFKVTEITI